VALRLAISVLRIAARRRYEGCHKEPVLSVDRRYLYRSFGGRTVFAGSAPSTAHSISEPAESVLTALPVRGVRNE